MKEREQKTAAGTADCLQDDRLEAEVLAGVQTFMEITENGLVEVQIDEKHLMELIVSPYNGVALPFCTKVPISTEN